MASKNLKGYAFEYFVRHFLTSCGFKPVKEEGDIIFNNGTGTMIQGLGQCHNADVLMEPPVQIPFYAPSRILVECKCHGKKIGLPTVRGLLGLKNDINNFDIITPKILKSRRNLRRNEPSLFEYTRCQYQVALATNSEVTYTAQEFSNIHRIPLILFTSSLFDKINSYLTEMDTMNLSHSETEKIIEFFRQPKDFIAPQKISNFVECVEDLATRINIGILDNGLLLFLLEGYKKDDQFPEFSDGFTLHWTNENNLWILSSTNATYYFELPKELIKIWINSDNKNSGALSLKEKYFRNIVIFPNILKSDKIDIIKISQEFLDKTIDHNN